MYIYRVEDVNHIGPYKSNLTDAYELLEHHSGIEYNTHPLLFHDIKKESDVSIFACFNSAEKLLEWFDYTLEQLHNYGFRISIYQATEDIVFCGTYQCGVILHIADLVDTLNIPEFLELMS